MNLQGPTPSWDRPPQQPSSESGVYDDLREQHRQQYQRKSNPSKLPLQQPPNSHAEQPPNYTLQQPPSSSFEAHDLQKNEAKSNTSEFITD